MKTYLFFLYKKNRLNKNLIKNSNIKKENAKRINSFFEKLCVKFFKKYKSKYELFKSPSTIIETIGIKNPMLTNSRKDVINISIDINIK